AARRHVSWRPHILPAAAGYLIGPAAALAFLLREHVVSAFLAGFHGLVPYYASLGHRPLGYILQHSVSPVLPLLIPWLCLLAVRRFLLLNRVAWTADWQR